MLVTCFCQITLEKWARLNEGLQNSDIYIDGKWQLSSSIAMNPPSRSSLAQLRSCDNSDNAVQPSFDRVPPPFTTLYPSFPLSSDRAPFPLQPPPAPYFSYWPGQGYPLPPNIYYAHPGLRGKPIHPLRHIECA